MKLHDSSISQPLGRVNIASGQSLDYETETLHEILIEVSDQGTDPGALATTVICYVTVTDVNEHDPDFTGSLATVPVPESTSIGKKTSFRYTIMIH